MFSPSHPVIVCALFELSQIRLARLRYCLTLIVRYNFVFV